MRLLNIFLVYFVILAGNSFRRSENLPLEECGNAMVDLVVVVDSSGSVESVFNAYRDATIDLLRMIPVGSDRTLVTLISYSEMAIIHLKFRDTHTPDIINKTTHELSWTGGTTHSAEAVDLGIDAYNKFGRSDADRIFVLMTDGNSYNNWDRVMDTVHRLHNTSARIYVVALGDSMYWPELEAYAGTNGTIILREDFNKFKGEILDLTGFTCHRQTHKELKPNSIGDSLLFASNVEKNTNSSGSVANGYGIPPPAPSPAPTAATIPQTNAVTSPVPSATPQPTTPLPPSSTAEPTSSLPPPSSSLPPQQSSAPQVPSGYVAQVVTEPPEATGGSTSSIATSPALGDCAADFLFILDSSGSVRNDFDRQINFILTIVDRLTIDMSAHLVAVVEYAGEMRQRLQFSFTAFSNKNDLISAIKALPFFSGSTATGEALKLGKHAMGDRRKSVPAVVIVLTDGFSQDDVNAPATDLRSEPNTVVYAVGVTTSVNDKELANIAGDTSRTYSDGNASRIITDVLPQYVSCANTKNPSTQPPTTALPVTTTTIAATTPPPTPVTSTEPVATTTPIPVTITTEAITTTAKTEPPTTQEPATERSIPTTKPPTPVVTKPPETPAPTTASIPGSSTPVPTTVPATTSAVTTEAPPTTIPPATTAEITSTVPPSLSPTTPKSTPDASAGQCVVDLMFVLDSSGSVERTFLRELEFAVNIVDRLVIGPENARVSAIKYAGEGKARSIFSFDKFNSTEQVKRAILASTFISGTTATGEALALAANEYDPAKGARPGKVPFLLIVFTDGFSQQDPGPSAETLRSKGAIIYALGVNKVSPVNKEELKEIAGDESRVFTDATIDQLYDQIQHSCNKGASDKQQVIVTAAPPATIGGGGYGESKDDKSPKLNLEKENVQLIPTQITSGVDDEQRNDSDEDESKSSESDNSESKEDETTATYELSTKTPPNNSSGFEFFKSIFSAMKL